MRLVDCYSQFSFRGSVRIFQILNLVFKLHYRAIKLFSSLFVFSTDREVKQSPSSLFALLARSWIALNIRHCNSLIRTQFQLYAGSGYESEKENLEFRCSGFDSKAITSSSPSFKCDTAFQLYYSVRPIVTNQFVHKKTSL